MSKTANANPPEARELSEASRDAASVTGPHATEVLILAGGGSRRMGREKWRLEFEGTSLLERTVTLASRLELPLLVAGRAAVSIEQLPLAVRKRALLCEDGDGEGPMAGVLGAARASPNARLLVLACDLPLLSLPLLRALLHQATTHNADIAVPITKDRLHPLSAVYSPAATTAMQQEAQSVGYSLARFIEAAKPAQLAVHTLGASDLGFSPEELERVLFNCNTQEDWKTVQQMLTPGQEGPIP